MKEHKISIDLVLPEFFFEDLLAVCTSNISADLWLLGCYGALNTDPNGIPYYVIDGLQIIDDDFDIHCLTEEDCKEGLEIMLRKHPEYFEDVFFNGTLDGIGSDLWLQYTLYNEIVYV